MLHLSDEQLRVLLTTGESDRVERKERLAGDAPNSIREAICAFANDLPGRRAPGVVVVGVTDDGRPSGVPIDDELLRKLADMRDDGNILRVGPRRGIASAQDERILNERRRTRDLPFDVQPIPTAMLQDLQRRLFEEEYLPAAFAHDVLAANERSYEQRLAALRMVVSADEPTPTLLGVLVLSPRCRDFVPGAYVQFLRSAGRDLADPIQDEEAVTGTLAEVLRRLDEKLRAHVKVAIDLTSSSTEERRPDYPVVA